MFGLLLFPLTAHAGRYAVTFSGGTGTATGASAAPTFTTATSGSDTTYTGELSFNGTFVNASALGASLSGPVTATVTWQPASASDPAPTQAVVERCTGYWLVSGDPHGFTGQCASGLGQTSGPTPAINTNSGMVSESKTVLGGGGASFPVTCSPSASAQRGAGTATAAGSGFNAVDVRFTVTLTIYPITVSLSGQNSANQALTGQQITAFLSTPNSLPTGTKITSYTWSFSGATAPNPIKNWDGNGTAADGTPQQLFPLTAADLTATDTSGNGISVSSVSFYDQVADNVTVKCAVSLKFSDSTTATVNAQSVPVAFLKPSASWNAYTTGPFVNASSYGANEIWKPVTITLPPAFTSVGGMGGFVQLITPSGQETRNPAPGTPLLYTNTYYEKVPDGKGGWVLPTEGLDAGFLYPFGYAVNSDGSLGASSTTNYHWDVSGTGASGDKPSSPYNPPAVDSDPGGTDWYTATTQNKFGTWLMYKPGSTGAIWVPLLKLAWSMNVTITKTNGLWAVDPSSVVTNPSIITADSPPSWTKTNIATQASLRP